MSSYIVAFDLVQQKSKIINMPIIDGKNCPVIEIIDGSIVAYDLSGNRYIHTQKGEERIESLDLLPQGERREPNTIVRKNNYEIFIPDAFSTIFFISDSGIDKVDLDYTSPDMYPDGQMSKFSFVINKEDYIYLQARTDGTIYVLNKNNRSIHEMHISVDEEIEDDLYKGMYENVGTYELIKENEMGFKGFIRMLENMK